MRGFGWRRQAGFDKARYAAAQAQQAEPPRHPGAAGLVKVAKSCGRYAGKILARRGGILRLNTHDRRRRARCEHD
jgi:hypothetical protein